MEDCPSVSSLHEKHGFPFLNLSENVTFYRLCNKYWTSKLHNVGTSKIFFSTPSQLCKSDLKTPFYLRRVFMPYLCIRRSNTLFPPCISMNPASMGQLKFLAVFSA